jgi:hypothetical protein
MDPRLLSRALALSAVLILSLLLSARVRAQLPSAFVNAMPNAPGRPSGYTYLETGWGSPNADDTTPILLRQDWNLSRVSVALGVAGLIAHNDVVADGFAAGIGAGVDLLPVPAAGNRVWGVRSYTGLAYASHDEPAGTVKQFDIPVVVGFGWVLPPKAFSVLPWLAGELRLRATDTPSESDRFDWGAGVQFGFRITKQQKGGPRLIRDLTRIGIQVSAGLLFIDGLRAGHDDVDVLARFGGHWTYQL